MIKISQITKSYNGRCVLDIPEFVFEQGGKYALIGANGSGKSTLLKILAATLQPDSGSIEYQPQQLKEQMGYMPQKPYIYDFSVLKNILIAFNHSEPNQEKAISALQRVGMEDFASARGSRLSGGTKVNPLASAISTTAAPAPRNGSQRSVLSDEQRNKPSVPAPPDH